jgi:small conductance mechanosensitive channel
MNWDELDELFTGSELTWQDLVAAIVLLIAGFGLSYLIGRWRRIQLGRPDGQSEQLIGLIARVGQVLVIAIFAGWALTRLGSDIGLLTVMVLVAVLIAVLAARPVLEGMGASAALTTRPAFKIGDEISVDETVGEVIEITNRSTVIKMRDARKVHIPNVEMLDKTVIVFTVDDERRSSIDLIVGLKNDIDHVEQVIRDALAGLDSISRIGSIRARGLTVGVELSVRSWHPPSLQQGNDALDDAVRAIKTALERAGIDLAASTEAAIVDTGAPASRADFESDGHDRPDAS